MKLNYYQKIARQFNSLKTKRRYGEKRERRAYLTEAYLDGELVLYKPKHIPYRIFTDKIKKVMHTEPIVEIKKIEEPVKFNWFEKFILWIKRLSG